MKRINYILCLVSLLAIAGCDDILDKGPLDTFSNDNFWTSENNVEGYANAFYNRFTGYGNGTGTGDFYFRTLSDDQAGNSFSNWAYPINPPASSSDWQNGWINVRRANIMLTKIEEIVNITDVAKKHWIGVGRMMRAWEYYKLVRMFGDVTWVENALDITDEGYLYGARDSRDIVMDKVLEDIDYACANMRDNGSKITFSQDLAYAMKSEICLYEGTFRKYRSSADGQPAADATGANKFLTESKSASSALMAKSYKLNSSYQGNYNSVSLSANPEMIFYKAYRDGVFYHSVIAYTATSTQISGMTKDAFDAYLFTDGKPAALTTLDNTDLPKMATDRFGREIFSISHLFEVRDKRLGQTIDEAVFHIGRNHERFPGDMSNATSTGYGVSKFDNESLPIGKRNSTGQNYTNAPLFWLAVIYLNYAEACAELGSITQTDLDNSINKLKTRAGLPDLTVEVGFSDKANNHGVSDLIWEIRRERRCELMFDNWNRYWDLVRWHQLDKLDTTKYPLLGANLSTDPDVNSEMTLINGYMDASKGMSRTFNTKYYLYPIPTGQIQLNKQLGQNHGWGN